MMLLQSALAFPEIDPVAVSIGPFSVHWYGIGYVAGILFTWFWARRLVSNTRLWGGGPAPVSIADLDDFVAWSAVGIILGGRIGYILFYDLGRILGDPLQAFAVWQGGMSFHGGFIGCTLAMIIFTARRGLPVWRLFDVVAAGAPVGVGLVRVTNFINDELWGRASDVPWAVMFPSGGGIPRHPSQLYEAALEGVLLFALLALLTYRFRSLEKPGFTAGAFVAGYGICRIIAEFFREPDAQLGFLFGGWTTMGMVLSVPMVLAGIWAMARARRAA
jgi:phosphatidylglycerol---prolipoprotein diacylglyceryl transferase